MSSLLLYHQSPIASLLKHGRLHLINANAQQLIWLCLEHNLKYTCVVLDSVNQIADFVGRDYADLHVVICDTSALSRVTFPTGYKVDVGFNTIGVVLGKGLSNVADYNLIHAVDLSEFTPTYFTAIKQAYARADVTTRDVYLRLYREHPTALYQKLLVPEPSTTFDWDLETDCWAGTASSGDPRSNLTTGLFNAMLAALTDTKSIQAYWIEIDKAAAMRLFGNSQLFCSWLARSEDTGKCRALAPLLLPFVRAFDRTKNVEYIRAFGRWCLYSRTHWSHKLSRGVSPYRQSYYCSFSELSLHRWQDLVSNIEQHLH